MELKLLNNKGEVSGSINASDKIFGAKYNEALIYQLITAYLANARSGNRAQKTRAEVRHSTKKPWRQKGTGRARSGMTSSPIWRGGGRTFPNKPDENFTQKVNKKMYRVGMFSILSKLVEDNRLFIIDSLKIKQPKTKEFVSFVNGIKLKNVLFLTKDLDENIYLSSRNLTDSLVLEARSVDPYSLLKFENIVLTKDAVNQLEEQWL